jgi:radical SAM protein with 4Fe4S-binding SPASM domain
MVIHDALPLVVSDERAATVPELPEELYLETTNRCNLRCKTCPQYFGMPEDSADLTPQRVRHILSQFPTIRRVVLHGIGEPLLNRDLVAIIAAVKERGAYALFNTNGLLLRPPLVEPLVLSRLDELRVSIDSASPETFRLVRGVNGFDRIIQNVRHLDEAKTVLTSSTPAVSLWITGMQANVVELPALVRIAAEIGVGEVYLQRLVYSERGLALEEQALYGRAGKRELGAVDAAERLATQLGVTLRGSGEAIPGRLLDTSAANSCRACRRPWSLMYVTANGNVLPCCIAPFTGVPYESIVLGNMFEQTAREIWNGPRYRAWRTAVTEGRPPDACRNCGAGWSL